MLAEGISNDKIIQEDELFLVKSPKSGETYSVNFGSNEVLPSCSCYDWKKNLMLCKHMKAVMRYCKDITWESFAPAYKNSNFLKIDADVIKGDSPTQQAHSVYTTLVLGHIYVTSYMKVYATLLQCS